MAVDPVGTGHVMIWEKGILGSVHERKSFWPGFTIRGLVKVTRYQSVFVPTVIVPVAAGLVRGAPCGPAK